AFERGHEYGELEVGLCHALRGNAHAGATEHRLPVEQLRDARRRVPGATLESVGLELEQVARQGLLEPREARLDAFRGPAQGRLSLAGRGRLRGAARPPLEQPAERERRDLAAA